MLFPKVSGTNTVECQRLDILVLKKVGRIIVVFIILTHIFVFLIKYLPLYQEKVLEQKINTVECEH